MNTILQKRIEEAAENHEQCYNVGEEHGYLYTHKGDIKEAVIYGAAFILQNQWISVDEGLPEKRQDVLVAVLDTKSNTYFWGFDNIDDDNGEFLRDKNGFAIENDSHKITHWMEIPSLKGGEK